MIENELHFLILCAYLLNFETHKLFGKSIICKVCAFSIRSETCPQCRHRCTHIQIKRIYIDFVGDEDLAIAQISKQTKKQVDSNTDAEEMIKILLEHIDNDSGKQQEQQPQQNEECDLCIAFQEAYDKIVIEKDQIVQVLNNIERENHQTSKLIEKLKMEIHENELNRGHIEEQLETSQKIVAAIQSENLANQRTIHDLKSTILKNDIALNQMQHHIYNLNEQIKTITVYRTAEFQQICRGILYISNGNQQRQFLKRCRESSAKNGQTPFIDSYDATVTNTNECHSIVPYCGDIDSWEYIMVPVLKTFLHAMIDMNTYITIF